MSKQAVNKKLKRPREEDCVTVHDIINKVNDSQKKLDEKFEELAQMCAPKGAKD